MKAPLRAVLIILLLLGGLLTGRADTLPGKTLTNGGDPTLQRDIKRTILAYEQAVAPQRKAATVVDTEIKETPVRQGAITADPGGKLFGRWVEHWTVRRGDGARQVYIVRFDAKGAGGTDFNIEPAGGTPSATPGKPSRTPAGKSR